MSNWWSCPNDPPCQHAALFHDIEDCDDEHPMCTIEDCDCGGTPAEQDGDDRG